MGKAFADAFASARDVFGEVDDALRLRLSRLMWQGPASELELTENAQPAIMAYSMAIDRVLEREAGLKVAQHARLAASHSLGEYSSLCRAAPLSITDPAQ